MEKVPYKYTDEEGNEHLHTWEGKPLTGTSSVLKYVKVIPPWWPSGLAVQTLGVPDYKILTKIKNGKASKAEVKALEESVGSAFEVIKGMEVKDFIALLDKAYRAHSVRLDESAGEGVDLHKELEKYVKWHMDFTSGNAGEYQVPDKIKPFVEWTTKNVKRFLWSEGHCFSADPEKWLGGICDAGAELNNGEIAVIDFKSAKDAYAEHFWQIAGYDIQISENGVYDNVGNPIYKLEKPITQHIVVPFGSKNPYPVVSRDIEGGRRAFMAALVIYREKEKIINQ